jgi:hypothetical protein
MELSNEEMYFLAKRARLVKAWRYVGTVLLVGVIGISAWLFRFRPLLADPFTVLARLNNDSIPASTMALSAALLPIMFLICMVLALAILLFTFAAFANEKKYLSVIRKMAGISAATPAETESAQAIGSKE